ncbi:MAG TPA: TonB family protein [Vicinamibacteria bacterium]
MSVRPGVLLLLAALSLAPRPGLPQDAPPKVAGVDVPAPKRTKSVPPHYPAEAQALGMRGIVILELVVGPDGKVVSARVTRSVPPFDDAALSAAREWEYEITKVDGKPVSVILTVPIEFKMRLPEMARDDGIPELRQGVVPAFPPGAGPDTATVTAEVTLDPDGHVAEARIKSGESPWAESVIQALRTWRFSPIDGQGGLAFEVKAEFASAGKGGPHVDLRLSGPRRIEAPPVAEATPAPAGATAPPAPTSEATPLPSPAPPAATAPASATPSPAAAAPSTPAPLTTPAPASPRPAAPPEELIRNPAGAKPAPPPVAATPPAATPPATGAPPSAGAPPAPGTAAAASPAPAPPATPAPPAPGISAVRDVTLAPGVPDLMKGRRPVAPPLARMQGVSGTVDVRFAVDAAGMATIREVAGPDPLKDAARQTVSSWSFRRSTPERLFLTATFTYKGDTASAAVRAQE